MSQATVRAKMYVNTVSRQTHQPGDGVDPVVTEIVKMHAVTSSKSDAANTQWAKWTPCGSLELQISNPGAQERLKPGMFFYVDLIPCERESP